MNLPALGADLCVKCNICTAACPVAAATDLFLGPKAVGPQAARFRHPRLPLPDSSLTWCSGCGTCSRVCPHGVAVAEINIQAKARLAEEGRVPLRDHLISRPDLLGRLGTRLAPAANLALRLRPARWMIEKVMGIHRRAPLPAFARRTFRRRARARCVDQPPPPDEAHARTVAYFHGCGTNYYEPALGELAARILEMLGCRVVVPRQGCCGLPLQSNGLFEAARGYARYNLKWLSPFAHAGIPIVGTSTSCTLSLKHDYRAILGLDGEAAEDVAEGTYDIFEYMTLLLPEALDRLELLPVRARALYHAPCQLRAHGIGTPALEVLRRIPGLRLAVSESECCGVAGTYGLKREKYGVAHAVGAGLLEQVRSADLDFVITDSETCRWWISGHAGVPAHHPVEIVARSLEII
ncbi:MAG TPA: anaerobic glycerol-3-phosphate dehydrogenase subunit C [Anaerolineales bacterium]|nr:anaerobic glycerol-3-phosphate dehydrogenase subunit C [Anaerolineales bacterium]